jgi:NADH:ubiquinone oxidoreductase subunit 5 (subunit L)/multisubunit Na+/H+ antiporter MnhA subunit
MKNKKVLKTILVVFSATILSLIIPIIGKWYEQKTGVSALPFYTICVCIITFMLFKIFEND